MKVSVLIPAYNCEATIRATLDSVLAQTRQPDEILVMDDGSTDQTASLLSFYKPRITTLRQPNKGVAAARNDLIARASGDLVAFLDSDDLWHPHYIEMQCKLVEANPNAAAFFVAHTNFCGLGAYEWDGQLSNGQSSVEVISPLGFIERFCVAPGPFVMSFCCVPKHVLDGIGDEPFRLREAEDVYFTHLLPFWGPIVYSSAPLAAYRIREGSLASNRMRCTENEVHAFELLENRYACSCDGVRLRAFRTAFAIRRRGYATVLLGAGMTSEARAQLWRSLGNSYNLASVVKSLGLLASSYMPKSLQPAWPSSRREWKSPESA